MGGYSSLLEHASPPPESEELFYLILLAVIVPYQLHLSPFSDEFAILENIWHYLCSFKIRHVSLLFMRHVDAEFYYNDCVTR